MTSSRIAVIDDDAAVLESLVSLLTIAGYEVASFPSAVSFLLEAPQLSIACLITDIRLPEIDGLTLIQRLRDIGLGSIPVIVISGHADVPIAVSAMQLGATTVLEKPYSPQRLLEEVNGAIEAGTREEVSEEVVAIRDRYQTLTGREREVLEHLTQGSSSKVTAKVLGISPRTVDVFRAKILQKMKASNIAGLTMQIARADVTPIRVKP